MLKADGSIVWIRDIVSVIHENGTPRWLRGIMVDITETKLLTELEQLEKQVLELCSKKSTDVEKVLQLYVLGIERLFPEMICSVHRVKDGKLYNWASPSLPAEYVDAIEGRDIGPQAGSCGTAAYLNEIVIVNDIAHDTKWAIYKDLALTHDLRACWSYPIADSNDNVIAAFGIYYRTIKAPREDELSIIERSAALLKVIIENHLFAHAMQEMNLLSLQAQELANFGTWQWDITSNKVSWSDVLYEIYGLDRISFVATFEGYIHMLHPEDRQRVRQIIQSALVSHEDVSFEERIIRPDGKLRYLRSWGRVLMDDTGKPVKMIGACLDITEARTARNKMQEIAWMQSHVVRAPLARLMGLVHLLIDHKHSEKDHNDLLDGIMTSANELDSIIRDISDNTKM